MKKNTTYFYTLFIALLSFFPMQAKDIRIENNFLFCSHQGEQIILKSKSAGTQFEVIWNVDPTWGKPTCRKIHNLEKGSGRQLSFPTNAGCTVTISLFDNTPFLYLAALLQNPSDRPVNMKAFEFLPFEVKSALPTEKLITLGSGGWNPAINQQGSFTYSLLADPLSRQALFVGWATQFQGLGMVRFSPRQNKLPLFNAHLEFGNFTLQPNQQKASDTLAIAFFQDGRRGLETYAEHLAESYRIQLPPKPEVHCTWYYRNKERSGASNQKDLTDNVIFAAKELQPFGLNVIQIDDEWQSTLLEDRKDSIKLGDGPVKVFAAHNHNFPSGMANMSAEIEKNGFTSGIWFMPFSGDKHHPQFDPDMFSKNAKGEVYEIKKWSGTPIDASSPKGADFLKERLSAFVAGDISI